MAQIFNVNQAQGATQYAGEKFFNLKVLAVSAGYVVRGSGDGGARFAYNGVTAALPVPEQASNQWDCWQTGNVRTDSTPAVAGDAGNASAWCVLEDAAGRQVLLQMTSGTGVGAWAAYGNIAVARAGSSGFNGAVAAAAVAPGAPTSGAGDEVFFFGSTRNSTGVDLFGYNTASTIHMWADTTPGVDGGLPLGWFSVRNTTIAEVRFWSLEPIVANESSADIDPVVYHASQSDRRAWDWAAGPTYTVRGVHTPSAVSDFWPNAGQVDPITGFTAIAAPLWVTTTNECAKGTVHPTSLRMLPVTRTFGFYGLDQNGLGWCTGPNSGTWCFPWPPAPQPVPIP